jgi:undecaprenyl-diphosphatase
VIASIPDLILGLPAGAALLIVFLIPALEASAFLGFIFPGEIAVILGGVLASQGKFPLWAAIAASVLGAIVGDSIGYEVGKRWGDRIVHASFGHVPIIRRELDKHLDEAREYVRKRGPHAVLAGRFTAALRVLVPGLAGMAELPYPTFLMFNAIGAAIWGTTFVLLGYFAGAAWHRVAADASRVGLALLALVLIGLVTVRVLRAVREHGTALADRLASLGPARWFRDRYPGASAWLAGRVDPMPPRGFQLSVAVVGAALALWLFGGLTQDVVANDEAALRDPGITSWIVAHRVSWLTDVLRSATWLGSVAVLIPLVLIVGGVLLVRSKSARPLIQVIVALAASILAYNVVRVLVDRPRPPMSDWLAHVSGSSFPSGHSADAAAAYGMLAVVLVARSQKRRAPALAAGLVVVPVVIAASRLYLGVHWFTDVVAGLALGWAVVAIVLAVSLLLPPRLRGQQSGDSRRPVTYRVGITDGE